jgi:hypothetical protein
VKRASVLVIALLAITALACASRPPPKVCDPDQAQPATHEGDPVTIGFCPADPQPPRPAGSTSDAPSTSASHDATPPKT